MPVSAAPQTGLIKETVDALFGILKRLVFSERGCGKLGLTQ